MINKSYKNFGQTLENLRIKAELSYLRLGLGMSYNSKYGNKYHGDNWTQTYCKFRPGRIPKKKIMEEFADYFHLSPYYFYEYRLIKLLKILDQNRKFLDKLEKSMAKYRQN